MFSTQYIRRYWGHALGGCAIAGIISYGLFWLLADLSGRDSAANGLVLGVWGIVLSVAGFAVTIWQLQKTKGATIAATKAVQELRERIVAYDAAVEVQKAIGLVQETQRHIRIPSWESANASYRLAREAVLKLAELPSLLSDQEKIEISSMLADISTVSDKIDAGLIKGEVAIDRGRALRGCREHEDSLLKLAIALQRNI